MASTRAVAGPDGGSGAGLIGSAAELRWSRPDLTGALADHVLEPAARGDDARWLEAAGWVVHARSATNDGRESASDVLDGLAERGAHLLDDPCAARLRVELAGLATAAGRVGAARGLLAPVVSAGTAPELRADGYWALARCAVEDRPDAVAELVRAAVAAWTEVGGPRSDIGIAAAALVEATAERRAGRAPVAVERAAAGLARLERVRTAVTRTPSRHLAAALAAEWIFGLLDAGRVGDARDGCAPLESRLREPGRPSRQIALLRLAVARTLAVSDTGSTIDAVQQAARDAAGSDAPDLESVCWSTLGSLQEKLGRLDTALESMRAGVTAQQRDGRRSSRFLAALDAVVPAVTGGSAVVSPDAGPGRRSAGRGSVTGPLPVQAAGRPGAGRGQWTDWSTAVAQDRTSARGRSNGGGRSARLTTGDHSGAAAEGLLTGVTGPEHVAEPDGGPTEPTGSTVWTGWSDDSPIGKLLARSMRPDAGTSAPPSGPVDPLGDALTDGATETGAAPGADRRRSIREPDVRGNGSPAARAADAVGPSRADGPGAGSKVPAGPSDPWSTGLWQSAPTEPPVGNGGRGGRGERRPGRANSPAAARAPVVRRLRDGGGHRRRADPGDEPGSAHRGDHDHTSARARSDARAADTKDRAPLPELREETESQSWLRAALAELDRAWPSPARAEDRDDPPPSTDARGCVVIVDLVRDGQRFAGRRAATVIHALSDRLADRLPDGARLRHDDTAGLSVVLSGWDRSAATEWMHRTLPGLLEKLTLVEELPSTQIRASVHDADGPVGAQLLQRLDTPPRSSAPSGQPATGREPAAVRDAEASRTTDPAHATRPFHDPDPDRDPSGDLAPDLSSRRAAPASRESEHPGRMTRSRDRGRLRDAGPLDADWDWDWGGGLELSGGSGPAPAGTGRHDASARTPLRVDDDPGSAGRRGRRHRREADDGGTAPDRSRASRTGAPGSGTDAGAGPRAGSAGGGSGTAADDTGEPGRPGRRHRSGGSGHGRTGNDEPMGDETAREERSGGGTASGRGPRGSAGARRGGTGGGQPTDASTDGLGLADLLAGALDAYRGI